MPGLLHILLRLITSAPELSAVSFVARPCASYGKVIVNGGHLVVGALHDA
jgi:hypothetical protein